MRPVCSGYRYVRSKLLATDHAPWDSRPCAVRRRRQSHQRGQPSPDSPRRWWSRRLHSTSGGSVPGATDSLSDRTAFGTWVRRHGQGSHAGEARQDDSPTPGAADGAPDGRISHVALETGDEIQVLDVCEIAGGLRGVSERPPCRSWRRLAASLNEPMMARVHNQITA